MQFIKSTYLFLLKRPYAAILFTVLIGVLCFMPSENIPKVSDDKTAHFLAFASLGFLWMEFKRYWTRTFIWLSIYAVFIEIVQYLLPVEFHRSFDFYDILADILGILIGFIFYLIEDWLSKKFVK